MFVYTRLSEDKKTIFYKNVSDKTIEVRLEAYDCYSEKMLFQNELTCTPNVEYFTYFPYNFKNRKLLIFDKHTNQLYAPFILEGSYDLYEIDYKNYIRNLFGFVAEPHDLQCIEFVINEHGFIREYKDIIEVEVDDVVVDVGFNYGLFSLMALKKGAKEIWGFEPDYRIYNNVKNYYPDQNKVHIFNFAVWDKNSTITFHDQVTHCGSTIYEIPEDLIRDSYDVRTINLYDFFIYHNISHIDLLKIDCEGAEYDIIESIPKNYLRNIRKINIEYHNNNDGVKLQRMLTKLEDCGFEIKFGNNSFMDSWFGMIYCKNNNQFNHKITEEL